MEIHMDQKGITLDYWQSEVLKTKGNICLRSGRQVGKSTVIGIKAAKYALSNDNKIVVVISKTDRQSNLLFTKILYNLHLIDKTQIKKGKDRPTKHKITLKNKTVIHCLPAGDTGYGIMGFTIDLLIADEAAFIPEEVWNSIIPALAITRGEIWLLSTPFVKQGYYYKCFTDPAFTSFHTSSEDCPRKDQVFLDRQKETLTKAQYLQMYKGEFVDEIRQFFPDELIKECCVLKRRDKILSRKDYYLGCDVARMDRDEFTYEIIDAINENNIEHVESIVTRNVPLPESARRIMELNKQYDFKKELIDSGGMGIAICDILRESDADKRKVIETNNASRVWGRDEKTGKPKKKRILKEEMYNHLKRLMEQGKIQLLDDNDVKSSLKCVQAEHHQDTGKLKIWSDRGHIVEGLVRAVFGTKNKSLNIYFYT